jgi:hypothetical protein
MNLLEQLWKNLLQLKSLRNIKLKSNIKNESKREQLNIGFIAAGLMNIVGALVFSSIH